jgi:hypothetical protein
VRHDGPLFDGEAQGPPEGPDAEIVVREPYLRRVLEAFESGRLEPYEYTRRVLAINAATSTDQMAAIVEQPPDGSAGDAVPTLHRGLDAVDLALLGSQRAAGPRRPTARYVTLAVVFVMFALLIGMGMWLATHVPTAGSNSGGTISGALALVMWT